MAVGKKVNKEEIELKRKVPKEDEIKEFINSGGKSKDTEAEPKTKVKKTRATTGKRKPRPENLQLRLHKTVIDRIDKLLDEKYLEEERPSRHTFLVEAITEKLKKEERKM